MSELITQIVKRIVNNLGLIQDNAEQLAIRSKELSLQPLQIEETIDNSPIKCSIPVWGGEIIEDNINFKAIIADFSNNSNFEYLAVYQMGDSVAHAVRYIKDKSNKSEVGYYYILIKDKLIPASIVAQAQALSGVEQLTSLGFVWKILTSKKELRQTIESLSMI